MEPQPLVDIGWLHRHRDDPSVRVVDCRYVLADPQGGRRLYVAGHLPGAVFLDVDTDLSDPPGAGRHPLPSPEAFSAAARRAGISGDTFVVAYDDGCGGASRLWWLLRHFGHDAVAVLEGGLRAWDGPRRSGEETVAPGDFVARPRSGDTVDHADLLSRLGSPGLLLVDARAPARYRGEAEPIDPVAGHIPGAVNLPFGEAFPPPADIVDADADAVVYCGSGITACTVILALAAAGRDDAKLYPGSWSDWVGRDLPVATGDEPGQAQSSSPRRPQ